MHHDKKHSLTKRKNSLSIRVVTTMDQLMHAYAVRAICFMEEHLTPANVACDGNDLQSTHFVAYDGEEPIGAMRVRWFNDFAKLERSAFRKEYRDIRNLRFAAEFVFEHVARKGYSCIVTHARPEYARLWERVLGFEVASGKPPLRLAGEDYEYIELVKTLLVPDNAITIETDAIVMARTEGQWDFAALSESRA
jgi:hypothetical protein